MTTLLPAIRIGTATALLVLAPTIAGAQSEEPWDFILRPYFWGPTINGSLRYAPPPAKGAPEVEMGPNDYLSHMNAGLMLSAEARKGDWAFITDLIYLHMGMEDSQVKQVSFGNGQRSALSASLDTGTKSSLKGLEWMLAASRTVLSSPYNRTEIFGGVRYLGIEAATEWRIGTTIAAPGGQRTFATRGDITQRVDLVDAIIGVRGTVRLGDGNWLLPYYLDVGAGESSRTWQAMTGISYRFSWGEATLAYRHVAYDQSGDKMLQSLSFSGPALGASFHF